MIYLSKGGAGADSDHTWIRPCLPISYCVSLIMVTITSHVFIIIFWTEIFSAVKFAMGLYEKYKPSCDNKISKSFFKKLKKSDEAPLTCSRINQVQFFTIDLECSSFLFKKQYKLIEWSVNISWFCEVKYVLSKCKRVQISLSQKFFPFRIKNCLKEWI